MGEDRCSAHGGRRCPTDVRLYGFADHCDALLASTALCRFADGTGIGDDVDRETGDDDDDRATFADMRAIDRGYDRRRAAIAGDDDRALGWME